MNTLYQDLRYALRVLLRQPGFTLVVVFTLAMGIGANTAIFSVVNAVLLHPLPYREPSQLMKVLQTSANPGRSPMTSLWPYPRFEVLREHNESFSEVAAFAARAFNLTGTDEPERVECEVVSANYLSLLGVEATRGRTFLPEEDKTPGTHPVALIGDGLWKRRFGGDPDVVGKTIDLNRTTLTIIGVLPEGFKGQKGIA